MVCWPTGALCDPPICRSSFDILSIFYKDTKHNKTLASSNKNLDLPFNNEIVHYSNGFCVLTELLVTLLPCSILQ